MSSADTPAAVADCARALSALPGVVAVDTLAADPRVDGPCIEAVLAADCERVPPRVLRCLAAHDRGIHSVDPQGEPAHLVMVVV